MDGAFFMLVLVLPLAFVATLVVAMILYPRLHVTFEPLGLRFEMHAWRPPLRRRVRTAKPRE
jgi:hypothetical protein